MKKKLLSEELSRIQEMMGLNETQLDMFADTEDFNSDDSDEVLDDELIGNKVMVYYNLHKHVFSVTHKGLVKSYSDYVRLKDVEFRVRQGGNEKVRSEERKNVHAFVIGTLVDYKESPSDDIPKPTGTKSITYNPYKYKSFVYKDSEEPIYTANEVELINQPSDKIFQISEVVSTNLGEEILSEGPRFKDYVSKLKGKLSAIKDNLKQEGVETMDAINKLINAARTGEKLSDSDKEDIGNQLKDLLKLSGLMAISVLPGGIIAAILIKFFKKEDWVTPSSFKDNPVSLSEDGVNISYTSEKVDESIVEAEKYVAMGDDLLNKYGKLILNSSLQDVHDDLPLFTKRYNDLKRGNGKIDEKFNHFYDVANSFEYGEWPDNVKRLDTLVSKLDDLNMSLSDIVEIYDEYTNVVERLSRNNKDLFN